MLTEYVSEEVFIKCVGSCLVSYRNVVLYAFFYYRNERCWDARKCFSCKTTSENSPQRPNRVKERSVYSFSGKRL